MHHTTPMHQRPSYLVWIEVAGIVGLGALLLGLPAVLALEMTGGGGSGGGAIAGGGGGPSAPPATARGARPAPTPIPGLSPGPSSGGGAFSGGAFSGRASSPTPFSDGWQAQAAPDLAGSGGPASPVGGAVGSGLASNGDLPGGRAVGPSGSVGGRAVGGAGFGASPSGGPSPSVGVGGGPSGGGSSEGGPALAARGPTAGAGGLGAAARSGRSPETTSSLRSGRRSGGDRAAREDAEQLAGTMQALSGQLRQMGGAQSQGAPAEPQDSGPSSPDDPSRREPGSPENVPIGDHLHWLAVAGILWGAWRIGRGA